MKEQTGMLSMVMMPYRHYNFVAEEEFHSFKVPRKGNYKELWPDIYKEDIGDFDIYNEAKDGLWLPALTNVLLATGQYPDLELMQFFVPASIKILEEEIEIIGRVVTFKEN